MDSSSPDSHTQRRLRSSSAHHRSMSGSRFSSPPPPATSYANNLNSTFPTTKGRRSSTSQKSPTADSSTISLDGVEAVDTTALKPCTVRRTYICKVCTFISTNPREFLCHQKDYHGMKQTIRECPYCIYATIYTHKLVRHITLVHKKTVVRSKGTRTKGESSAKIEEPKLRSPPPLTSAPKPTLQTPPKSTPQSPKPSSQPPKLVSSINQMYPGSISPSTLPPPPAAHKLTQNRSTMALPRELEMIPVNQNRRPPQLAFKSNGNSLLIKPIESRKRARENSITASPKPRLRLLDSQNNATDDDFEGDEEEDGGPGVEEEDDENEEMEENEEQEPNANGNEGSTSPRKVSSCSYCSFKSTSRLMVDRHETVAHLKKKYYRCTKCTYVTNVKARYTKHVRYHSMPYIKCELCDFSTPYKWNLDRHRKNHIDEEVQSTNSPRYRCHLCTFRTFSSQSLNCHVVNHHTDGGQFKRRRHMEEGGFYSEPGDNNKGLDEDGQILDHENEDLEENEEVEENGEAEENEEEQDKEENLAEDTNGKTNGSIGKFERVPGTPEMIKCDLCPYKAKWISEVVRHRRVHQNERPFSCPKCSFSSRWKGDLTRHFTKYHQDTDSIVENIDQILDQSMMIGGEEELEVYNRDAEAMNKDPPRQPAAINYQVLGQLMTGQAVKQQITAPVQLSASVQLIPTNSQQSPSTKKSDDGPIIRKKYQCPYCVLLLTTTAEFHSHLQSHAKSYACSNCTLKGNEMEVIAHLKRVIKMKDPKHQGAKMTTINHNVEISTKPETYENYAVYETVSVNKKGASNSHQPNAKDSKPSSPNETLNSQKPKTTVFKCKYCQYRNRNRRIILRHLQVHTENKDYWCGICGQSSNSEKTILRHCQVRHNVSGPILNRGSASLPSNKSAGGDKAKTNTPSGEQEEDEGFVVVEEEQELALTPTSQDGSFNKVLQHDKSKSSKFHRCSICPYRCRKVFDLRIHSFMHKPHKGADYKCSYCPFYVTLKGSLLNHMKLHTDNDLNSSTESIPALVKKSVESTLENSVVNENQSVNEMKPQSATPAKRYVCEMCPYSTNSHTTYFYHRQFHRPSRNAVYKCSTCNYSVSRLHLLHQHERVHDTPAPPSKKIKLTPPSVPATPQAQKTPVMSKRTPAVPSPASNAQSFLQDSMNNSPRPNMLDNMPNLPRVWVHRDGVFKKMFKCRFCPHVSKKRNVIFEHEKMHMLREAPGSKANYHCHLCNYSCMNGGILTSHMRVHRAQNSSNFYISEDIDEGLPLTGAGKSRWTSTPKSTARKGMRPKPEPKDENEANLQQSLPSPAKTKSTRTQSAKTKSLPDKTPTKKFGRSKSYYQCEHCPAKFDLRQKIRLHKKCHFLKMKYKCSYCSYSANHMPHIRRHSIVHTPEYKNKAKYINAVPIHFSEVDDAPPYLGQPSSNGASASDDSKAAFTCSLCPAVFIKESTLLHHVKMHDGNAKYKCSHCSYSVFTYSNLVRHAQVHGIDLPPEEPSKVELKKATEEKAFKCSKCPAEYDTKDSYDVHVPLHGSGHQLKCDRCDYSVKYEANLIRHRHLHDLHDEGKTVPTKTRMSESLEECDDSEMQHAIGASSTGKSNNESHSLSNGENEKVKKLFQCPKCPYTHMRIDAVQNHLKRHSSANSEVRCPHCDYGSNMQSFLRDHIKLHFDPQRLRQVEAFAHWEELEVWVRSGNHKTLIYRYALGEEEFTEDKTRSETIENLSKAPTPEEKSQSAEEASKEAEKMDCEPSVEKEVEESQEAIPEKPDEEEIVKENDTEEQIEAETTSPPHLEPEIMETNAEEVEEETQKELTESTPKLPDDEENNEEEEQKEEEDDNFVLRIENSDKDTTYSADTNDSLSDNLEGVKEDEEVAPAAVEEETNGEAEVELEEETKKVDLEEENKEVELEKENKVVEDEKVQIEDETKSKVEEITTEQTLVEEIVEPTLEEKAEEITEVVEAVDVVEENEEVVAVEETKEEVASPTKDPSEKLETSEEEIIVDVCSEENEERAALAVVPAAPAEANGVLANENAGEENVPAENNNVIEEGTVSMDDMALQDNCTTA